MRSIPTKKRRQARLTTGVLGLGACLMGSAMYAQTVPAIGLVRLSQTTGVVANPVSVTVTAAIDAPTLIASSVNLLQLNADGTTKVLGSMHDDGLNGDVHPGDQVFSFAVTFNSSAESQIQLQVSAAFKGILKRLKSPVVLFNIQKPDAAQQTLKALAQVLASGDVATALTYVVPSEKSTTALHSLGQSGLNDLALMMQKAVPLSSQGDLRVFQTDVSTPSGTANVQFTMVPAPDGRWLVNTW